MEGQLGGLHNHTKPEKESCPFSSSPTSYYKTCATSKVSTAAPVYNRLNTGTGELNESPLVPSPPVSGALAGSGDSYSQRPGIPIDQASLARSRAELSPMSQACESSVISGCNPVKYVNRGEMFTEHSLCPGPPEHKNNSPNGRDRSFEGVVSAIGSMNLSMNTSRLSSIDLATSFETYAAVIHSRTNSSADAEKNEACANCFDHAAVFWMEWAAIQAKIQVSLIEDLYKLKELASSIENGRNSTTDVIDVDSIRAVAVKLTKTSHESFKEAYEKGSDWSSIGGLDYWVKKLPEPVIKDASTINACRESSTRPHTSFGTANILGTTIIDRQFASKKDYHGDLTKNKNSAESFDCCKLDRMTNSSDTLCSFKNRENVPDPASGILGIEKADSVVRRNNERCVHSFKYPNGRSGGETLPPAANRRPVISRSPGVINFDMIYSDAIEKSNNNLQVGVDLNAISEETDSEGDENQDARREDSVNLPDIILGKSINAGPSHQLNSRIKQNSEVFSMDKDYQQADDEICAQGSAADMETINEWDNPPSSYLYRPLSYAITEEGSIRMTPPRRQVVPGAAVGHETPLKNDVSAVTIRPSNIRRKGKFHKKDGSILMLPKRAVDHDSSSEDDANKENTNLKGRGANRREEPGKPPITTIDGGESLVPPKLQHIEIPFFDRGPTAIAQPLEPNYNYPDQYPSRGYFSEDLSERSEDLTLEVTRSLPEEGRNQNHPRWANRFKKIIKFPRGNEQTSLMSPPSLKRQLSPDPENPMSPSSRQKKSNLLD